MSFGGVFLTFSQRWWGRWPRWLWSRCEKDDVEEKKENYIFRASTPLLILVDKEGSKSQGGHNNTQFSFHRGILIIVLHYYQYYHLYCYYYYSNTITASSTTISSTIVSTSIHPLLSSPTCFSRPPVPADLTRPGVVYTQPVLPALPPKVWSSYIVLIIITIMTIIIIITITIIISNIIFIIAAHGASCLHSSISSQRGLSSHLCC